MTTIDIQSVKDLRAGDRATITNGVATISGIILTRTYYAKRDELLFRFDSIAGEYRLNGRHWTLMSASRTKPLLPTKIGSVIVRARYKGDYPLDGVLTLDGWYLFDGKSNYKLNEAKANEGITEWDEGRFADL